MGNLDFYTEKRHDSSNYTFNLGISVSLKFAESFLKSLNYEIVTVEHTVIDDRYMEIDIYKSLCAIKVGETPDLDKNKITDVFREEYEKILLSLLINARDINYYEQLIKEQNK